MGKNKNKNKKTKGKTHSNADFAIEQDENFCFIAGYTSGGFPYGTTWEETDIEPAEEEEILKYFDEA